MARYIDADALIEEIESLRMHITGLRAGKGFLSECMKEYKKSVLRIIDEQPTAFDLDKAVDSVRVACYQMGFDESQTEIIVDEIRNGGKE